MARAKGTPKTGGRQPGTPNKATAEIRDIAKRYGPAAIEALATLAGLVKNKQGEVEGMAESETARIAAIGMLLDRAYGKAAQPVVGDDDGEPVKQVLEVIWTVVDPVCGSRTPANEWHKNQGAAALAAARGLTPQPLIG